MDHTFVPFDSLTFANDFLFCKILESRPDLCQALVELICIEEPELVLPDETKKVFLCTEGTQDDISANIKDFLNFVAGRSANGPLAKNLREEVQKALTKEEWRKEYMENMAVIMDAKREGRAEGRAKGRAEGRAEGRAKGREEERADTFERVTRNYMEREHITREEAEEKAKAILR